MICADRKMDCQEGKPTHELIREQGHKSLFVETDVAEESSVQALIKTAVHEFGRLDM